MTGRRRTAVALAVVAAWAGLATAALAQDDAVPNPADATAGYTYFNKPGADLAAHNRDVRACALVAGRLRSPSEEWATQPLAQSRYYYPDPAERNYAASGFETCMVVRGWRVVALPEAEGKALTALAPDALAAQLSPWIGAAEPHGQVVRVWSDEALRASVRFAGMTARHKRSQLSLKVGAPDLMKLPSSPKPAAPSPWTNPRWPIKPLTAADLATLRPDAGVILVQVRNPGFHGGIGLIFNREGADPESSPSAVDHGPDRLRVGVAILFAHSGGDMFAYAVPPGRWRIYGLGLGPVLNLCLGSPSFEVKAGETVYAGAFDLSAEALGPDMDLAPARKWLGGDSRPLRAAAYVNGSQGPCDDSGVDALEFKGAPYEPDYAWGGAQAAAPPP